MKNEEIMTAIDTQAEELNPLQIFLLAMVKAGLKSPYDLLMKAGLGAGLTSPALKRLEAAGLLHGTPGPRNRMRYAITRDGLRVLRGSLEEGQKYWCSGKADIFDSLPRAVVLAWLHGGVEEASRGVAQAANKLLQESQSREREAETAHDRLKQELRTDLGNGDVTPDAGTLIPAIYRWIKAESDAKLYRLQAEAVQGLAPLIKDLPSAPNIQ
jgi:DNA-binding PadR family transcriptional regulator